MTIITNTRDPRVTAIFLRAHIKLQLRGLSARGTTKASLLALASSITGNEYKRGKVGLAAALADLSKPEFMP